MQIAASDGATQRLTSTAGTIKQALLERKVVRKSSSKPNCADLVTIPNVIVRNELDFPGATPKILPKHFC